MKELRGNLTRGVPIIICPRIFFSSILPVGNKNIKITK